jgi:hypothetical protein
MVNSCQIVSIGKYFVLDEQVLAMVNTEGATYMCSTKWVIMFAVLYGMLACAKYTVKEIY